MAKRIRSPNYPSISLADAVSRLATLFDAIQTHSAPRDVVLEGIGYTKAHGVSLTALSALGKYGLLDREGDDYRISDRGVMLLHPETEDERRTAILEAAAEPRLFADINERFPGGTMNDGLLRSHLIRKGFAPSAIASVLQSYRETHEFVHDETARVVETEGPVESEEDAGSATAPNDDSPAVARPGLPTSQTNPPPVESGKFRVSMTDEFHVDVAATRLGRSGVQRLIKWLQANEGLVPEHEGARQDAVDGGSELDDAEHAVPEGSG